MNLTLEGDGKNDDRGNSSSDVGMIEVVCGRYSLVGDMVAVGAGRAGWNGAVSVRVEDCAFAGANAALNVALPFENRGPSREYLIRLHALRDVARITRDLSANGGQE